MTPLRHTFQTCVLHAFRRLHTNEHNLTDREKIVRSMAKMNQYWIERGDQLLATDDNITFDDFRVKMIQQETNHNSTKLCQQNKAAFYCQESAFFHSSNGSGKKGQSFKKQHNKNDKGSSVQVRQAFRFKTSSQYISTRETSPTSMASKKVGKTVATTMQGPAEIETIRMMELIKCDAESALALVTMHRIAHPETHRACRCYTCFKVGHNGNECPNRQQPHRANMHSDDEHI